MTLSLILVVLALICFVLATFNVASPVNLVAGGLSFLTVAALTGGAGVLG